MSMDLVYSQSMKSCGWCGNELSKRQRTYCCRACQAKGVAKSNTRALVAIRHCDFCGVEYEYHPEWKQDQNTRYCKRECKDTHQQITYQGDGNPMFTTTWSEEQRVRHGVSTAAYWSLPKNRERHRKTLQRVAKRLGHWPGQGPISCENRKQTYREVYGVDHPWMNPVVYQKCEMTTLKRYGKHTWEIARQAIKKRNTDIEIRTSKVLVELGVEYMHPYVLTVGLMRREFDFYVPQLNILIEVDGDYHHANPMMYEHLDKTQRHTRANDVIKDAMALEAEMRLLRFWGSDVMRVDFQQILKETLWEKS